MPDIKFYDEMQIPTVDVFHMTTISYNYRYIVFTITLSSNQYTYLVRNNTVFLCIINREYLHIYSECILDNSLFRYLHKFLSVNSKYTKIDVFQLHKYYKHTISLKDLATE